MLSLKSVLASTVKASNRLTLSCAMRVSIPIAGGTCEMTACSVVATLPRRLSRATRPTAWGAPKNNEMVTIYVTRLFSPKMSDLSAKLQVCKSKSS